MDMRKKHEIGKDGKLRDLKEEARHEAQGEMQRWLFNQNRSLLFMMIVRKPSSFSDLVKATKFSEPTIWKYLRSLKKDGSIIRDTVKPNEGLANVGDIVYRATSEIPTTWEDFFRPRIEESLGFLFRYFDNNPKVREKIKRETDKFVAEMVRIVGEDYQQWKHGLLRSWKK